ncbi:MAG: 1,4-dihydroxy-2-naphthoate octaprenyltransferase, partial [Chloroflexota bacterium]
LAPATIRVATMLALAMAVLVSIPVVAAGGWPILLVGIMCIAAAILYTGIGPVSLADRGLGDPAAFLFFGVVGVCGSAYVQSGALTADAVVNSFPMGLLVTAILVVNNLRDIDPDRMANKRTMAVLLGRSAARIEYLLFIVASYALPLLRWGLHPGSSWFLLPWLTLPAAIGTTRAVFRDEGASLNRCLARTALITLLFALLFSASLIL